MDDEDVPQLSAETVAILQEFFREKKEQENVSKDALNNEFQEDWQLSQFWYDDKTVKQLTSITKQSVKSGDKIALISCPTLYKSIKDELSDCEVHLYEYDRRFSKYEHNFIKYDYNDPLNVPERYRDYYDLVIADPPFLSEECLTKTASTIRCICKGKIILCTGAVMIDLAQDLLSLKKAKFEPTHKNNLANEFYCYSNYNIDDFRE